MVYWNFEIIWKELCISYIRCITCGKILVACYLLNSLDQWTQFKICTNTLFNICLIFDKKILFKKQKDDD
jgi:hypothetical protein